MIVTIKNWFKKSLATQVDLTKDLFDEQNHLITARDKFLNALPYWVAGAATGVAAIFYAKIFIFVESIAVLIAVKTGDWILLTTPA